MQKLENIFDY